MVQPRVFLVRAFSIENFYKYNINSAQIEGISWYDWYHGSSNKNILIADYILNN